MDLSFLLILTISFKGIPIFLAVASSTSTLIICTSEFGHCFDIILDQFIKILWETNYLHKILEIFSIIVICFTLAFRNFYLFLLDLLGQILRSFLLYLLPIVWLFGILLLKFLLFVSLFFVSTAFSLTFKP